MPSNYNLIIVESPSKCKKIEEYLNEMPGAIIPYKCIASYGHIRELKGLESIDINNNFIPKFIECLSKKDQITKIKKEIMNAKDVILASDDDREGEAIAWHICEVFKLPITTTKRIIFHEITKSAIHKAIETPTLINMKMVQSQLARQVLDILVGYKLSPLLWKHVKDGLSAGRCQTPALRIIYENQKEIDSTKGKQSYTVTGYFTNKNIPFVLNHEEENEEELKKFLNESIGFEYKYKENRLTNKIKEAPLPFTTSTLQQTISNELHISPKETMKLCQTLYESGYITYPRTDSINYSDEFKCKMRDYIVNTYGDNYISNQLVNASLHSSSSINSKLPVSQNNAHEAIRPTNIKCEDIDEIKHTAKENRVYGIIRRRALESCMANASVSVLSAKISAPNNYEYRYTTESFIFPGWKIVYKYDDVNKEYTYLQQLKEDTNLIYKKIKAIVHVKELKTHYTEARLIQLLEEKGIGRPSTYSSIIDKIQERSYVKKENIKGQLIKCNDYEVEYDREIHDNIHKKIKTIITEREFGNEKNKLVIQNLGIIALEFLLSYYGSLFEYKYTQEMENALDLIANNKMIWYELCKKCNDEIEHLSSSILVKGKEMIRIDDNHVYMVGKYGPVIKCTLDEIDSKTKKNKITFKPTREDIDLTKLKNGEYTLNQIVLTKENKCDGSSSSYANDDSIGSYKDIPIYIKGGKFGKYLEWNNTTKSLKHLKKEVKEIDVDDVIELVYDMDNQETNIIRNITDDASIRKGKYGAYVFYKTKKMKKPRFLKMDGLKDDYLTCDVDKLIDWFKHTYKIDP